MAKRTLFNINFDLPRKGQQTFILKILLVIVLAAAAVFLVYTNKSLVRENKKMIKFINNEQVFQQNLEALETNKTRFAKYVIDIKSGTDLEKIKADYINQLLRLVEISGLKVDSYRSGIEKKDGFVVFKYNVTIVGDFVRAIRFFSLMRKEAPHIYVARYDIRLHLEKLTRMGLTLEIVAVEG